MDNRAPSMLKSTLIGGAAFGFLGGLPIIGGLNCLCCSLFVAGGFLAAFLYSRECRAADAEFRVGNGALVGLVAGLFYAITTAIVSGIVNKLMPTDPEQTIEMLEQFDVPPETIDMASKWMENTAGFTGVILSFFMVLLLAAVFSTIGGLIGGAVFKSEPPSPPPPTPASSFTPPSPPAPPTPPGE